MDRANLETDLRRFLGLPPYNDPSNVLVNDGYFWKTMMQRYSLTEEELRKEVERLKAPPSVQL